MKKTTGVAIGLSLLLASGVALAAGHKKMVDTSDPASVRQHIMGNVGGVMKLSGAMAKGKAAYDARVAAAAFRTMNAAALGFASQFPRGSEKGHETEASPDIWSDSAGFQKAANKFIADTAAAVKAAPADLGAFKKNLGMVAANCKACHKAYRIKK